MSDLQRHYFPVRRDLIVCLQLPRDLTTADAERIAGFVNSLVFDRRLGGVAPLDFTEVAS